MKSLRITAVGTLLLSPLQAFAGSTITVTWAPVSSAPVPMMGTVGLIITGLLVALVALRLFPSVRGAARHCVLILGVGGLGIISMGAQKATSDAVIYDVDPTTCSGSQMYAERDSDNYLRNNCATPVAVSYDFDACGGPDGTEFSCLDSVAPGGACADIPELSQGSLLGAGEIGLLAICTR